MATTAMPKNINAIVHHMLCTIACSTEGDSISAENKT